MTQQIIMAFLKKHNTEWFNVSEIKLNTKLKTNVPGKLNVLVNWNLVLTKNIEVPRRRPLAVYKYNKQ